MRDPDLGRLGRDRESRDRCEKERAGEAHAENLAEMSSERSP